MTKKELESKTVLELRALAKKLKITLGAKRKADIIKELLKGVVSPTKGAVPPAKKEAKPATKKKAVSPAEEKAKAPKKRAKAKAETPVKTTPSPVRRGVIEPSIAKVQILPPEPGAEYGEDMVTAIIVEPSKIFVFWELRESTIKKIGGSPFLRIYDVTGIEDKSQSQSFFDIDCKNRIGSRYIDLSEGKEYIVEIGLSTKKKFIPVAQSQRTSTFRARPQALKEPLIPEEYLDYLIISEEGSIPR